MNKDIDSILSVQAYRLSDKAVPIALVYGTVDYEYIYYQDLLLLFDIKKSLMWISLFFGFA